MPFPSQHTEKLGLVSDPTQNVLKCVDSGGCSLQETAKQAWPGGCHLGRAPLMSYQNISVSNWVPITILLPFLDSEELCWLMPGCPSFTGRTSS